MKRRKGLFRHLAWTGIRNNYKLYVPYILAAAGMTAMFYIIFALSTAPFLKEMAGGTTSGMILGLGVFVIGIFAVIFMFYTNSFLIRTRTKEFGLYNILGMSRGHIAKIVAIETLMAAGMSIAGGLVLGILFEKLAELLFSKMIGAQTTYNMSVHPLACLVTAGVFLIIFLLVMLRSVYRIFRMNTIDLLKSESFGEKPPKAKWLLTLVGIVFLACAYFLAVAMAAPVQAITMFFFAVILVIISTYILFISGSVSMCRTLQKNKKYYYKTTHFVSLSSMVYRMKRNGAGLASICILSTMVLVMISSTSCLYFGKEASIDARYPRDVEFEIHFDSTLSEEKLEEYKGTIRDRIAGSLASQKVNESDTVELTLTYASSVIKNGVMLGDQNPMDISLEAAGNSWDVYFVTLKDYNRYMGENRTLAENEVICCIYQDDYKPDTITLLSGTEYRIVEKTKDFFAFGDIPASITPSVVFVAEKLPNLTIFDRDYNGIRWKYLMNLDVDGEAEYDAYMQMVSAAFNPGDRDAMSVRLFYTENKYQNRADFFGMYGGLFFLGIALSIVFTFALVLIIYYKQITEGYEDRSRYEIMRKVGMTRDDIRKSVNSQMGSVFYMPLAAAVVHLCFATPMIFSMLKLFSVTEIKSLIVTAAISVAGFGIIYTIVYKITSNSYYKLVS